MRGDPAGDELVGSSLYQALVTELRALKPPKMVPSSLCEATNTGGDDALDLFDWRSRRSAWRRLLHHPRNPLIEASALSADRASSPERPRSRKRPAVKAVGLFLFVHHVPASLFLYLALQLKRRRKRQRTKRVRDGRLAPTKMHRDTRQRLPLEKKLPQLLYFFSRPWDRQ